MESKGGPQAGLPCVSLSVGRRSSMKTLEQPIPTVDQALTPVRQTWT